MELPHHGNASKQYGLINTNQMSSSLNLKLKDYILTIFTAMAAALGPLRSLRHNLTYPEQML